MAQDGYDALERGVVQHLDDRQERFGSRVQQPRPHRIISPSPVEINSPRLGGDIWGFQAQRQRPQRKNQTKWATNGPAMQAVFLGTSPKPCGTGVFIPQTQSGPQFSRKPAFSPVLLPARVVQVLNLNIHELDRKIKPQSGQSKNVVKKVDEMLGKKDEEDDVIYISPDILLPKEWTY